MKNIVLLGYKGTIGKKLYEKIKNVHKVFTDEKLNIKKLTNKNFLIKNNINFIINCIGVKDKEELFFSSNYVLPSYISKNLSEIDPLVKKKILYIHISSIGVNNPFQKYNLNDIKLEIGKKQKLNYNLYEFSKAAGDHAIINNMKNLKNIKFILIRPSNIITNNSKFIFKLKIFLLILPFRIPRYRTIPITKISDISEYINYLLNKKIMKSYKSKNLYKRYEISKITKDFNFIIQIKPSLSINIIKYIIKIIPNFLFFRSLKRIFILLYFL